MFRKTFTYAVLATWGILSAAACTTIQSPSTYQQGQIIDLAYSTTIPFSQLQSAVLDAQVVYIGEAHYTPSHIEAALQVLQILVDEGRTPILGLSLIHI